MSDNKNDIYKRIDAYIKGSLSEEEISELWVEFAKEPDLLDHLELEVGVRQIVEQGFKSGKDQPTKIFQLSNWMWHASAAAVLLLVIGIQFFQVPSKSELNQFIVGTINGDQLETADGIRAKDMKLSEADSILNLGFNEFINGNSVRALSLYNEVISDFDFEPYGSKAFLNKGIVYYNDSEFDSAIVAFQEALERVGDSRMIEEKAYWYLGNALANTGELEEARTAVFEAYSLDGVFRKPAFLLLQKINFDLGYTEATSAGD